MYYTNPLKLARLTGLCWLITIIAGSLALFFRGWLGITVNLTATFSYVAATLFVFELLKPVDKNLAFLTACFGVIGSAIGLERMFLKMLPPVNNLGFIFFGLQCLLLGYLIFRSTYLPQWVGMLLSFGGLGWLIFGLTSVFALAVSRSLSPYIMTPGIVGETSLTIWLLVKGVDVSKWKPAVADHN